jgi:uncharacterized protein (DUF58 family)
VELEVQNAGLLPLPWLSLHESVPPTLHSPPGVREVVSLGAGERRVLRYSVQAGRRGYYRLGPLSLRTGDVLGLGERALESGEQAGLTVYPQVLPLAEFGLPASLPFGVLPASASLFIDPARPAGVRPYQPGDSMRSIDWKSSARMGGPTLLVRRHQPAIALETVVALAFGLDEYQSRFAYDDMERALVAAASIAAHIVAQRQPVGFCTSGRDPLGGDVELALPVASGRAHLIEILGILGRLEPAKTGDLPMQLQHVAARLGWGSTLVFVGGTRPDLLATLLPLRQRGLNIALVLADAPPTVLGLARRHGIAAYTIGREGRPTV